MNIVQKVNSREITPRHNNYQEVTIDAGGNGPVINFNGVHSRTSGLASLSPIKQSTSYQAKEDNKKGGSSWKDWGHAALDVAGFIPGIGAFADLANAAWYTAEGKHDLAAMSAFAAIPGYGDVGAAVKGTYKLADRVNKWNKSSKLLRAADIGMAGDFTQHNLQELGATDGTSGFSPFIGNEKGEMWEGGIPAAIPAAGEYIGEKYEGSKLQKKVNEWDMKDGIEGNKLSQFGDNIKGGISSIGDGVSNALGFGDDDDYNKNDNNNVTPSNTNNKPVKSNRPQKFVDYYKNKNK